MNAVLATSLASVALAATACEVRDGAADAAPTGRLALALAAEVEDSPIRRAVYDVRIETIDEDGNAQPFATLTDLESHAGGFLTFIGSCRSGADGAPGLGVVTATLKSLELADGVRTFGTQLPMTRVMPFNCIEGGDTPIDLTFEVVLELERGFTDLAVDLETVACAAKLDCVDALLPTGDGRRGPTLVTGLSCTGTGGDARDNLLAMARVIHCYDDAGAPVDAAVTTEPSYSGVELPGADGSTPAYWNTTTLFDRAAFAGAAWCRFEALGLVRTQPASGVRAATTRSDSAAIHWDIALRLDADGSLACDGDIGPITVPLRIDTAATPADANVSAKVAPVTWSTLVVFTSGADDALRLWDLRDVTFPGAQGTPAPAPAADDPLVVYDGGAGRYRLALEGACSAAPDEAWLIVTLASDAGPAIGSGGDRVALRLDHSDGRWGCVSAPAGGCRTFPLDEVSCTVESP